jgi:hypothetical protein
MRRSAGVLPHKNNLVTSVQPMFLIFFISRAGGVRHLRARLQCGASVLKHVRRGGWILTSAK